jgi:hypothetical protein
MVFRKLTDAEQVEFMELIRDSFDPELYDEDNLPALRENKRRFEESEKREEGETPAVEDPEEEWEPYEWRAPEEWPSAFPPFTDEV